MKLPARVRVSHMWYNVVEMSPLEHDLHECSGYQNTQHSVIHVRTQGLDPTYAFETFLHEVGHAINAVAHITDSVSEEDAVTRATPLWLAFWMDNPKALKLLKAYVRGNLTKLSVEKCRKSS